MHLKHSKQNVCVLSVDFVSADKHTSSSQSVLTFRFWKTTAKWHIGRPTRIPVVVLQALRWRCVKCVIHNERDVREEQHHTYMWREQAIIEWSRRVISIVACCQGAKLCAHAARDFRSQQNGAVTRMWRSCQGSLHTKNVRSVRFVVKRGCCCNLFGGVALIVWFTTNGMCAKNKNICMWREQAIKEWSRRVISVVACCHGANFVHMPLGISDRNTTYNMVLFLKTSWERKHFIAFLFQ